MPEVTQYPMDTKSRCSFCGEELSAGYFGYCLRCIANTRVAPIAAEYGIAPADQNRSFTLEEIGAMESGAQG